MKEITTNYNKTYNMKGVCDLEETNSILIHSKRKDVVIDIDKILYIRMRRNDAEIHVSGGRVYVTRRTYADLKKELDDRFIEVKRGCIVSALVVHKVKKKLELINGEIIDYTVRKKKDIIEQLYEKQCRLINSFASDDTPTTVEEYRLHYSSFEDMPFAFTDIEIVFNNEKHAVDWIFRYGNEALAKLEKIPLEELIGSTFGSHFSNMESKWLRNYERSAIYGETLEIIDYSPEIDTTLKIISFPTFKGHCGCILFDLSQIQFTKADSE